MVEDYTLRTVTFDDVDNIAKIYNSNPTFLENHLGVSKVSTDFIRNEIREMKKIGFVSEIIINRQTRDILGFCDYKFGDCIYLSLLMIDGKLKGQGIGTQIYQFMEKRFTDQKACSIRIDVVDDYIGNVLGFWEKQGFISQEDIVIEWNRKKSNAKIMKKTII